MKSLHNELARKRKSHIPEYREQVNSIFKQAAKSDLPQYINKLHQVVAQAYKRSEIPKPDAETHFSQLTQVKDVSIYIRDSKGYHENSLNVENIDFCYLICNYFECFYKETPTRSRLIAVT